MRDVRAKKRERKEERRATVGRSERREMIGK